MFVELFLPGAVIGTVGFLAVVGSIVYAFMVDNQRLGILLTVVGIVSVPFFFMAWKGVLSRYFALKSDEKGFSPSSTVTDELVGAEGVALSPLRPSGIARLQERRCDVVTRGEMLEKGTRIVVIEVSGNRIVVKRI
jgi:membrane-bound serine protease (ClpP class)